MSGTESKRDISVSRQERHLRTYYIKCDGHPKEQCSMDYIGETKRNLKARLMEHRRLSSTSSQVSKHIHDCKPGQTITIKNVRILDREPSWF
ncbi:hypothetical protein DPMN_064867 [Dreissena polymorpha]|uniref:GIY-YIG domain-containing protein n=1 Tax=Dreissena polymorpha TaxID=45954 RepID=A0A9D4CED8_DREPO|nr:hypothetical protein DPMN_064867 [Dreissena polymorpha]